MGTFAYAGPERVSGLVMGALDATRKAQEMQKTMMPVKAPMV
jgi:hypothetical protein